MYKLSVRQDPHFVVPHSLLTKKKMQTTDLALCIVPYIPLRTLFAKNIPCVNKAWNKACWDASVFANETFGIKHLTNPKLKQHVKRLAINSNDKIGEIGENQITFVKMGELDHECNSFYVDGDTITMPSFPNLQVLELNTTVYVQPVTITMPHVHSVSLQIANATCVQNILQACPNVKHFYWRTAGYDPEILQSLPATLTSFKYRGPNLMPELRALIDSLPLLENLSIRSNYADDAVCDWLSKCKVKHMALELYQYSSYTLPNVANHNEMESILIHSIPEDDCVARYWLQQRGKGLKHINLRCYANDDLLKCIEINVDCKNISNLIIGTPQFFTSSGCPILSPKPCLSLFKELYMIKELHLYAKVPETALQGIDDKSMPFLKRMSFHLQGESSNWGAPHTGVNVANVLLNPKTAEQVLKKFPNVRRIWLPTPITSAIWNQVCKTNIGTLVFTFPKDGTLQGKVGIPLRLHMLENRTSHSWKDQVFHLLVWHANDFDLDKQPIFKDLFQQQVSAIAQIKRTVCENYLNHHVMQHIMCNFVNKESNPFAYNSTMQYLAKVLNTKFPFKAECEKAWEDAKKSVHSNLSTLFVT